MEEAEKKQGVRTVKAGDIKPPWEVRTLPEPPPLGLRAVLRWAGPAVILGALSVGGFEAYHAGFVASKMFIGIFWIYWVACICQLFLNQEIARYTIATGETLMQGFSRMNPPKLWCWFSIIFCWLQTAWPAWITGAAAGVAAVLGLGTWQAWSLIGLVAVFLVFAFSRYVYDTLEIIMFASFIVANAGVVFFTITMATPQAALETTKGWLSVGLIPAGVTLTMIGPFISQPAGGFWNLWHTYWVREKGMGMGRYFGKVTGLSYKPEDISRSGYIFDADNPAEVAKFKKWLRLNNITLAVFFIVLGGILFTYFISMAGYSAKTIYKMDVPSGWKIAVVMAEIFKTAFGQFGYIFFGVILVFALFDTQFSVYDGIARMWADTFYIEHPDTLGKKSYRFWYFLMLAGLVACGALAVFLKTPYVLWLIANWSGAASLAFTGFMVIIVNRKLLPKEVRPRGFSLWINLFYATFLAVYFIVWTIVDRPF